MLTIMPRPNNNRGSAGMTAVHGAPYTPPLQGDS